MATKKIKKNAWEELFVYPSFNIRFGFTILIVVILFGGIIFAVLKANIVTTTSDKIAILSLIISFATLSLGVFAAYYALRQLVETRFTSLDEAGTQEIKRNHYSRAFEKWREAFYIKPEAGIFTNMCETLLLIGDNNAFDQYIKMSQGSGILKKEIVQEISDQIVLLYLKTIRHLLVKNQGEAEKYLSELVQLVKKEGLSGFEWDFLDMRTSLIYQDITGECKNIAENLISYLSRVMPQVRRVDFEKGNFATQVNEVIESPAKIIAATVPV